MKLLFLLPLILALAIVGLCLTSAKARSFAVDVGYRASQLVFGHMARNGLILGAYAFPEGATFNFANTFASAKTITAITNANPAVATSAAHGYTTGDEILLTSGWEDATDTVYTITVNDANSFRSTA
jgi:hypothetical protein